MPNPFVVIVAILSALLGAAVCYWATRQPIEQVVEVAAPPINHADGSVTAARVVDAKPAKPAPSKPKNGRPVRTVEVDVLPEPVVCPATGEVVQCKPVGIRIDLDEYRDGLRASLQTENGEILDAVDYSLGPWFRLQQRKNRISLTAYQNGTAAVDYSWRIGPRVWVGPSLLLERGEYAVIGATIGADF